MPIKKALLIILALFFVLIIAFMSIYFGLMRRETIDIEKIISDKKKTETPEQEKKTEVINIQDIIDKKNNNESLTDSEKKQLNEAIKQKTDEIKEQIKEDSEDRKLTDEEINFLMNPTEKVSEELGIEEINREEYSELQPTLPQNDSPADEFTENLPLVPPEPTLPQD